MITQQRAAEIVKLAQDASTFGPWTDNISKVMEVNEYEELRRIWLNKDNPGSASVTSTLLSISNGVKLHGND